MGLSMSQEVDIRAEPAKMKKEESIPVAHTQKVHGVHSESSRGSQGTMHWSSHGPRSLLSGLSRLFPIWGKSLKQRNSNSHPLPFVQHPASSINWHCSTFTNLPTRKFIYVNYCIFHIDEQQLRVLFLRPFSLLFYSILWIYLSFFFFI
jgi:hypothetical protein